jgi:hypothetical protein
LKKNKLYEIKANRLCPEKYCFLWDDEENKCDECYKELDSFSDCIRRNIQGTNDFYEPCEPYLEKDKLPINYFVKKWMGDEGIENQTKKSFS